MKSKVMKSKRRSTIATGKLAKAMVLRGSKVKTTGGLKRESLFKNKRGRIVSKKASASGLKRFQGSKFEQWTKAVAAARKALSIRGFVALNGRTLQGKALYAKAKTIYEA